MVKQFVEELNPAIVSWDVDLFELILWKIPTKWKDEI
jgi:hypothetical protein